MIALLGVVIGAVLAGGVQATLSRAASRKAARTAGKLVAMAFVEGWTLMLNRPAEDAVLADRCGAIAEVWRTNRTLLAAHMRFDPFSKVALFFALMERLAVEPGTFRSIAGLVPEIRKDVEHALDGVMLTRRERRNGVTVRDDSALPSGSGS